MTRVILACFSLIIILISGVSAQQCGWQAGGKLCPGRLCCSQWGWCGITDSHCGVGCQSQCSSPQCGIQVGGAICPGRLCCSQSGRCGSTEWHCGEGCQSNCREDGDGELGSIISREIFDEMLKHRNDNACPARGFYTYDAFISAAKKYPAFGTTGNTTIRKREIAAFFAQTSHETTGGWPSAPDGPYAWGYCFLVEINPGSSYCAPSINFPCAPGKQYFGRGPIQLSWNFNYGQFGAAIGVDLLNNPDLVAQDRVISFESALWFWMTPQPPKPSAHDVITDQWFPSVNDLRALRLPGYGVITNIINGGLECGRGWDARVASRIGFYQRYCDLLGVDPGLNLDCYDQLPFGFGLSDLKNSTEHSSV